MSLTKVSYSMIAGQYVNAIDFGAVGNGTTDDTTALQNAINNAIANKKSLFIPGGTYKTTATLTISNPYSQGFQLFGDGEGTTVIVAYHIGNAVLSMIGATNCCIEKLTLQGNSGIFPKCGIIVGRSSASSSGWHQFNDINVLGSFSVAAIYNIASEGNGWYDIFVNMDATSTAKYGLVYSGSDLESIGGLTASSCLDNFFYNFSCYVSGPNIVAAIYIQGAVATGNIGFYGGYLVTNQANYVYITTGIQDGLDTYGNIVFDNVNGETSGSNPNVTGFRLTAQSGNQFLRNLTIRNCSLLVGFGGEFINQNALLGLKNCWIDGWGIIAANNFAYPAGSTLNAYGDSAGQNTGYINIGNGYFRQGSYTPTITAQTGTITAYTAIGYYYRSGDQVTIYVEVTISNKGTGSGQLRFTLPFVALPAVDGIGTALDTSLTSVMGAVLITSGTNSVTKYDSTTMIENSTIKFSATYISFGY
jgi:hypothetical protein